MHAETMDHAGFRMDPGMVLILPVARYGDIRGAPLHLSDNRGKRHLSAPVEEEVPDYLPLTYFCFTTVVHKWIHG